MGADWVTLNFLLRAYDGPKKKSRCRLGNLAEENNLLCAWKILNCPSRKIFWSQEGSGQKWWNIQKLVEMPSASPSDFGDLWLWHLVYAFLFYRLKVEDLWRIWFMLVISALVLSALPRVSVWIFSCFISCFEIFFFPPPILYRYSIQKDWNKHVKWLKRVLFPVSGFLTLL